jgi:hypothetical protein
MAGSGILEDPTGRSKEDLLRKKKSRQSDQKIQQEMCQDEVVRREDVQFPVLEFEFFEVEIYEVYATCIKELWTF